MNEFQPLLGKLVEETKPAVVVETGFMTGVSTKFILDALSKNGKGVLYSIDPFHVPTFHHERLNFVWGYSYEQVLPVFNKSGCWDLFVHDSDHDPGCMAFELEIASQLVKGGGIIACDDYTWGEYGVWQEFLKRHGYTPIQLGSAQYCLNNKGIQCPLNAMEAQVAWHDAAMVANAECSRNNKPKYFPKL
jgi:hypothetical protein